MFYSLAAEITVIFHMTFIVFAILGGLVVLKWPKAIFLHIPAMVWAALIMLTGWICPLTPLEKYFRRLAGEEGYEGGFIAHYLLPIIYPSGLTRGIQIGAGVLVVIINVAVYWLVYRKRIKSKKTGPLSKG